MEARIYYIDGCIETHRIPEYLGGSSTNSQNMGVSDTLNEIDRVRRIVERFSRDAEGFWLERIVDKPAETRLSADGSKLVHDNGAKVVRVCVLPADKLDSVNAVELDGEQVYPEAQESEGASFDSKFFV